MQDRPMKRIFVGLLFVFAASKGQCAESIGKVAAVEGVLKAEGSDRNQRILSKGSDVFLGDTLITEATAKGQIEFTDGTLVLLIPDSRYSVDSYTKSHLLEQNRYAAKLYEGGVRILTGLIAKKNPENFELSTPNATIGVRGTLLEARMFEGNLFAGSSSGKLTLTNPGGSLGIGGDASNQFASVSSMRSAPEGLSGRPPELNLALFSPPPGGIPFDELAAIGSAAAAGQTASLNTFAWGPAAAAVAAFGAMAGVIIANAGKTQPKHSFSH